MGFLNWVSGLFGNQCNLELTQCQTELADVKNQLGQLRAKYNQANSQIDQLKANIATGNNQLSATQTHLSTVQSQLSTTMAKLDSINSQTGQNQSELAQVKKDLTDEQSKNASLSKQLNDANTTIDDNKAASDKIINGLRFDVNNQQNLVTSLGLKIDTLTPNEYNLDEIIVESLAEIKMGMPPHKRAKLWYGLEDALWKAFTFTPSVIEKWTQQQIKAAIVRWYPDMVFPDFADVEYAVTNTDTIFRIYQECYIGYYPYVAEGRDCDDFAERFRLHVGDFFLNSGASVFGWCGWGNGHGYHAFDIIPCIDGLVILEPQESGSSDWIPYIKILPDTINQGGQWLPEKVRVI